MLRRGINVCLGTDSLASNDSLSILDELRFIRAAYPAVDPRHLLDMATRAGAAALGLDKQVGTLAPGRRADFLVVPLAHPQTTAPLDDLLHAATAPAAVFIGGEKVYGLSS